MAKYIDADELELEYYDLSIHGTMAVKSVLPVFAELLKKQPTADVAEVVRCRNCMHCEIVIDQFDNDWYFCKKTKDNAEVKPDGFCSYGERKDAE